MPLSKRDKEFRLPKISYVDFKHLEMDRVLTGLFSRLAHNGYPSRLNRKFELTIDTFVDFFADHPEWFSGFDNFTDILERWVETHLMDVVNRGKPNQAIAAPRPLHGFTYRFRNSRHSKDYGASQHLFELINGARKGNGQRTLEHLKSFFFQGHDQITGQASTDTTLDVETQALLRLLNQVEDAADTRVPRDAHMPLCIGSADLLAEDIQRILFYQNHIPRSVMVDYLKTLMSFHLALYHLRIMKLLPALLRRKGGDPMCSPGNCPMDPRNRENPQGDCPYRVEVLVDVANRPGESMALLAERSADQHFRRIPAFVKAYIATKKLDEFAADMIRRDRMTKPPLGSLPVSDILQLLDPMHKAEREKFFGARVYALIQDSSGSAADDLDPEIKAVTEMDLCEFDTYIEMLVALRGQYHRQSLVRCLDSLMLKNQPGALLAQGRTAKAPRRFVLDSRLLEVLLQVLVLKPGNGGFYSDEMRVDELLEQLRQRYGICVDTLPHGDGFGEPGMDEHRALRVNRTAFTDRLREIGFYRDLSDAYVTQTVTPRYRIDTRPAATSGDPS
jgi:hypothetical protein